MRSPLLLAFTVLLSGATAHAQEAPLVGLEVRPDWLVLESADHRGRQPFNPDAVFARHLLRRGARAPVEGEIVRGSRGQDVSWERLEPDEKGGIGGGRSISYAYTTATSAVDRVVMAALPRGAGLYVNGTKYVGDVYGAGTGPVPVALRAGKNDVFVRGVRGSFRLDLAEPLSPLQLTGRDTTKPDLREGAPREGELAVVVANTTLAPSAAVRLVTSGDGFERTVTETGVVLPPLAVAKLPVRFRRVGDLPATEEGEEAPGVTLEVRVDGGGDPLEVPLAVRTPVDVRRITFRSGIDGSVQEYSVRPPAGADARGLVLSAHGAGVDAYGQARSYSAKPDYWIVAATNRRPFGFDWQDWGRRDAYEVLAHALAWTGADPATVCLTGHSMGGHGTWHLGANDPDRWAAIAPSAGWATFDSYTGRPDAAREQPWYGADLASDTMALLGNLVQLPTFVLHGTADDNVPASEAEAMLAALREAGAAPRSHFQEGAGHWWNGDAAEGADCVDWPGIFELFRESRVPADPAEIDFTTADPGVDAEHHWLRIEQPVEYGRHARVRGTWKREEESVTLATEFARVLRIRLPGGALVRRLTVDGWKIPLLSPANTVWLSRAAGLWTVLPDGPTPGEKTPARSGPFKRAFDRRFVLVHGTAGSDEETRELLERARHDSQSWRYRGNGLAQIVSDTEFAFGSAAALAGRNVILYGNADTNAAWDLVFEEDCPLRAERGRLRLGEATFEGDDLGAVFVHRRRGDDVALAAAFADTGPVGSRLGYALLPFVSGVGYPDYAVFGPEILEKADGGVRAAGWFDHAWRLR